MIHLVYKDQFLRSAKSQVVKESQGSTDTSSIMDDVITGDGQITPAIADEERQVKSKTGTRIQELESELKSLREERKKKEQDWEQGQDIQMEVVVPGEQRKPLVEPTTKPKRGVVGADKKKAKGTREMIKSKR